MALIFLAKFGQIGQMVKIGPFWQKWAKIWGWRLYFCQKFDSNFDANLASFWPKFGPDLAQIWAKLGLGRPKRAGQTLTV